MLHKNYNIFLQNLLTFYIYIKLVLTNWVLVKLEILLSKPKIFTIILLLKTRPYNKIWTKLHLQFVK